MVVLSPDDALGASLARHHLCGTPPASVEDASRATVGLHNTTQSTPHLSLLARDPGFTRCDFDRAAWDDWIVARFRAMRLTMFVLPHDLLEVAAAATRHLGERTNAKWLEMSGMSARDFDAIADDIESALATGPLTTRAIRQYLGADLAVDIPGIVGRLCDMGRLVGGRPPRSWRSSVREYHRWNDVLPTVRLDRWDPDEAAVEIIRRYIASYGPVTLVDIAWWTGFTKRVCAAALDRLDVVTELVEVEGWPGPLIRMAGETPEASPDRIVALPLLDPYVQGYKDRERLLATDRHGYVWDSGGNAAATILRRGRIIGVWQTTQEPTPAVLFHLFEATEPDVLRRVIRSLSAAGELYFGRDVDVLEQGEMAPLGAEGRRTAAHPLDGHTRGGGRSRSP